MPDDDKYVRVYYSIRSDERFADVYGDDRRLATWLRLLLDADAVWPAPASIPAHCNKASLDALVKAGIVELLPNSHFRIHGLDAERERRSSVGRAGGLASARSRSVQRPSEQPLNDRSTTVQSLVQPTSNLDEQSIDEQRRDEQEDRSTDDEPEFPALQWLAQNGCYIRPGNGYHQKLVLVVENHGIEPVLGEFNRLQKAGVKHGDVKGFLFGAEDALNARTRPGSAAVKEEDAEERARIHSKQIEAQMWRRRIERYQFTGEWDEAWGPPPEAGRA